MYVRARTVAMASKSRSKGREFNTDSYIPLVRMSFLKVSDLSDVPCRKRSSIH